MAGEVAFDHFEVGGGKICIIDVRVFFDRIDLETHGPSSFKLLCRKWVKTAKCADGWDRAMEYAKILGCQRWVQRLRAWKAVEHTGGFKAAGVSLRIGFREFKLIKLPVA